MDQGIGGRPIYDRRADVTRYRLENFERVLVLSLMRIDRSDPKSSHGVVRIDLKRFFYFFPGLVKQSDMEIHQTEPVISL
jgi:hypothetical protein